ncbi:MAG: hypothetical protein BWK75_02395 [Candidatus Altiarchaeales archaeon A3]|nr:MAG: hypothetical protein BWK75_02395 [Candidatus Altiarchaeales archaeon A3]
MHFSEGNGTFVKDSSGRNNDGILNVGGGDNAGSKWVEGYNGIGNGLRFDGVNDYVDAGDINAPIEGKNDFTISWWENPKDMINFRAVMGTHRGSSYVCGWDIVFDSLSNIYFVADNVAGDPWGIVYSLNVGSIVGNWTMFTLTRSGNHFQFYKNGVAIGTGMDNGLTICNGAYNLQIGVSGNERYFNGSIDEDEVRIYNRSLSAEEIREHYLAGKARLDYQDLRFVYYNISDGSNENGTEIPYWFENDKNIWVKVPEIPGNSTMRIWAYYGNNNATTKSNPESTFIIYDDFLGSTLNESKWRNAGNAGSATVSNGILTVTAGGVGSRAVGQRINLSMGLQAKFRQQFTGSRTHYEAHVFGFSRMNQANEFAAWWTSLGCRGHCFEIAEEAAVYQYKSCDDGWCSESSRGLYIANGQGITGGGNIQPDSNWHTYLLSYCMGNLNLYQDGVLWQNLTSTSTIPTMPMGVMFGEYNDHSTRDAYNNVDWVFVAKYALPEPIATAGIPPCISLGASEKGNYVLSGTAATDYYSFDTGLDRIPEWQGEISETKEIKFRDILNSWAMACDCSGCVSETDASGIAYCRVPVNISSRDGTCLIVHDIDIETITNPCSIEIYADTKNSACNSTLTNNAFASNWTSLNIIRSALAETSVNCSEVSVSKNIEDPGEGARCNEILNYTIRIMKNTNKTLSNIRVADTLPGEVTFVGCGPINCNYEDNNRNVIFTMNNMGADTELWIAVKVTNNSYYWGSNITNIAYINYTLNSVVYNKIVNYTTAIKCSNLTLQKTADSEKVYIGDDLEYELTVSNTGNGQSRYLEITDTLPYEVEFINFTKNNCDFNCTFTSENRAVKCTKERLTDNRYCEISFKVNVTGNKENITNIACIRENNKEVMCSNVTTNVVQHGDFYIIKNVNNKNCFNNGDDVNFTIVVENNGSVDIENLVVEDILPAGLSYIGGDFSWDNGALRYHHDGILGSGLTILKVNCKVNTSEKGVILTNNVNAHGKNTFIKNHSINIRTCFEENVCLLPIVVQGYVSKEETMVKNANVSAYRGNNLITSVLTSDTGAYTLVLEHFINTTENATITIIARDEYGVESAAAVEVHCGCGFNYVNISLPLYTATFGNNCMLFSVPVQPVNESINSVLGSLDYEGVFAYGNGWNYSISFGGSRWGTLSTINLLKGYWMKLSNSPQSIKVNGIVASNGTWNLNPGWNLVGWPLLESRNISSINIPGDVEIYTFGNNNIWEFYDSRIQNNSLTKFEPWKGYWIKLNVNSPIAVDIQ